MLFRMGSLATHALTHKLAYARVVATLTKLSSFRNHIFMSMGLTAYLMQVSNAVCMPEFGALIASFSLFLVSLLLRLEEVGIL